MEKIILMLLATLFLNSCGKLSKEEAQKLIVEEDHYNKNKGSNIPDVEFPREYVKGANSGGGWTVCVDLRQYRYSSYQEMLENLQKKQMIVIRDSVFTEGNCIYRWAIVDITPEGKKYLLWQGAKSVIKSFERQNMNMVSVKLYDETFRLIESIKQEDTITSVTYCTYNSALSPFGEILMDAFDHDGNYIVRDRNAKNWVVSHVAYFKKDNGKWKLVR